MIRKPTNKVVCCDCGKMREAYKPITKHVDGHVDWVCRQCWRDLDYIEFMGVTSPR